MNLYLVSFSAQAIQNKNGEYDFQQRKIIHHSGFAGLAGIAAEVINLNCTTQLYWFV